MDFGNLVEIVVDYLLIRGMVCLNRRDRVLMVDALVCIVTHWIWPMMNHSVTLLYSYDSSKLLDYSQPWEDIEFVLKSIRDFNLWVKPYCSHISIQIRSLWTSSNKYSQ